MGPARDSSATFSASESSAVIVTPAAVRQLACHEEGSRAVQRALDEARSDDERRDFALQFKGHVWDTITCPYANYALQKCVTTLRPQDTQFIIDELSRRSDLGNLARHKYGCRLLQRLFEHCREDQLVNIGHVILSEAIPLSRHCYGNYVMQHLATYGSDEHRSKMVDMFERQISSATSEMKPLGVLNCTFEACDAELRLRLARAICNSRGLLVKVSQKRRGHQVAQCALEALPPNSVELENARAELLSAKESLLRTRYGRSVLKCCQAEEAQISDNDIS